MTHISILRCGHRAKHDRTPPNRRNPSALYSSLCTPKSLSYSASIILASRGEGTTIRPPFFCDYGYNIHLGTGVFLNFNCVLLDVNTIEIGDRTQIGPAVQIYAADHPRNPEARRANLESGRPVRIGANVWIGGAAIILPGISIGEGAVIGAGSVVTHDVSPGATVLGNPARLKTVR